MTDYPRTETAPDRCPICQQINAAGHASACLGSVPSSDRGQTERLRPFKAMGDSLEWVDELRRTGREG